MLYLQNSSLIYRVEIISCEREDIRSVGRVSELSTANIMFSEVKTNNRSLDPVAVSACQILYIFTQINRMLKIQAIERNICSIIDCLSYNSMAEITILG